MRKNKTQFGFKTKVDRYDRAAERVLYDQLSAEIDIYFNFLNGIHHITQNIIQNELPLYIQMLQGFHNGTQLAVQKNNLFTAFDTFDEAVSRFSQIIDSINNYRRMLNLPNVAPIVYNVNHYGFPSSTEWRRLIRNT